MKKHNGIAIALAWPETLCKQAGSWYDTPLKWLGINKNYYYKVGHAAVVLIESETGDCHYFDFGRYHSPFQQGRVRSSSSDHDLEIKSKGVIVNNCLTNFKEILLEVSNNESCHGNGHLHASYCFINFNSAYIKAIEMQKQSPIRYGPFLPMGTNCSRFVNTVILSGKPNIINRLLLVSPKTLSPTPISNVKALQNYFKLSDTNAFISAYNRTNSLNKYLTTEMALLHE